MKFTTYHTVKTLGSARSLVKKTLEYHSSVKPEDLKIDSSISGQFTVYINQEKIDFLGNIKEVR